MFSLAYLFFFFPEDSILMLFSLLLLLCVMLCSSGIKGEAEFDNSSPISSTSIHIIFRRTSRSNQLTVNAECAIRQKNTKHIVAGSTKLAPSDYTKTQKGGWSQPLDDT